LAVIPQRNRKPDSLVAETCAFAHPTPPLLAVAVQRRQTGEPDAEADERRKCLQSDISWHLELPARGFSVRPSHNGFKIPTHCGKRRIADLLTRPLPTWLIHVSSRPSRSDRKTTKRPSLE